MHHVIAIDDTPTNLVVYRQMLKKDDDINYLGFEQPEAALEWLSAPESENPADLILLDYMMPRMNGLEFMASFGALGHRKDVPIVMVTADTERSVRLVALESGARDFLTKPVDKVELLARVNNLLILRNQTRQLSNRALLLASEVRKATQEIHSREREIVHRLSLAAEYRDLETGHHIKRMAKFSQMIAQEIGLPEAECELILEAAPMHDIGKVAIPDEILLKPARLTEDEWGLMKRHAELGYSILSGSKSPLIRVAATIAHTHHEKWDGSGYPRGLKGDQIPIYGRVVAIADVYDALTSVRPYKRAWDTEAAVNLLRDQSGRHFDPRCVEAFLNILPKIVEIKELYGEKNDSQSSSG